MSETKEYKNPLIEFDNTDTTGEGHWVDGKFYTAEEWDMQVILTRRVKPFKDGTLLQSINHKEGLYHKLEGLWYVTNLIRPDLPWKQVMLDDDFFRANLDKNYKLIYEPGVTE